MDKQKYRSEEINVYLDFVMNCPFNSHEWVMATLFSRGTLGAKFQEQEINKHQ